MIATNPEIGKRLCVDKITSVQHPTIRPSCKAGPGLTGNPSAPKLSLLPYNPQWSSHILAMAILYSSIDNLYDLQAREPTTRPFFSDSVRYYYTNNVRSIAPTSDIPRVEVSTKVGTHVEEYSTIG